MVTIPKGPTRFTDRRGVPGEMVVNRMSGWINVWRGATEDKGHAGIVNGGAIGMILCVEKAYKQYTYVLWSDPCIVGWVSDGYLRRV